MTDPASSPLDAFEREIAHQEGLLYGIALFFEGIALLHAGQDAVVATYRKQFRNIIQAGSAETQRARELLAEARRDAQKLRQVEQFTFHPGDGYADPVALTERATRLLTAYESLFPGRPREEPLAAADTLRLLDAASLPPRATE